MKPVRKKRKKKRYKTQRNLIINQITNLKTLYEFSENNENYENIDIKLLKKLKPVLKKLNNIIGMEDVKQGVFLQILYYLQKLNTKNNDYLHTIKTAPPGYGKCMGKDTPIRMFDSQIKLIQNIKVNDKIMGDDSKPRTVLSITKGKDMLFKIKQSNGMDYIVNSHHILTLIDNNPFIFSLKVLRPIKECFNSSIC